MNVQSSKTRSSTENTQNARYLKENKEITGVILIFKYYEKVKLFPQKLPEYGVLNLVVKKILSL